MLILLLTFLLVAFLRCSCNATIGLHLVSENLGLPELQQSILSVCHGSFASPFCSVFLFHYVPEVFQMVASLDLCGKWLVDCNCPVQHTLVCSLTCRDVRLPVSKLHSQCLCYVLHELLPRYQEMLIPSWGTAWMERIWFWLDHEAYTGVKYHGGSFLAV